MSIINDIEKLANTAKAELNGPFHQMQKTYADFPKELKESAEPILQGVSDFSQHIERVVGREVDHIATGMDTQRYHALMTQIENKEIAASLYIGRKLQSFSGIASTVLTNLQHFDISAEANAPANSNYSNEFASLLQQAHDKYQGLCQTLSNNTIAFEPAPHLNTAFTAAQQMLEMMPAHLLAVMEKQIPIHSMQKLLNHLDAAGNTDSTVGLRAEHAKFGASNSTPDYLKSASKLSKYFALCSDKLGDALTKKLSVTVNAKVSGVVGVVAGWAAYVGAKLGIDVKALEGVGVRTVPFDVAAPYFAVIGAFFDILGTGLYAAGEWLELDAQLA